MMLLLICPIYAAALFLKEVLGDIRTACRQASFEGGEGPVSMKPL